MSVTEKIWQTIIGISVVIFIVWQVDRGVEWAHDELCRQNILVDELCIDRR